MNNSPTSKDHNCNSHSGSRDWMLWICLIIIGISYIIYLFSPLGLPDSIEIFSASCFNLMNKMWWGLVLAILFTGLLDVIPQEMAISALGNQRGLRGMLRATAAGVLLDLCSHGILMVGMKFYRKGVSLGQTMAFLIASPWNSFSMTIILFSLIGFKMTFIFIIFSCVIAVISGLIFQFCVENNYLPKNPNSVSIPKNYNLKQEFKKLLSTAKFSPSIIADLARRGFSESKMILRWVFLGVVIASTVRVLFTPESFQTWFGPSLMGLALTVLSATIIEVCSEGSAPIASELLTVAKAPGNSFTFMMTGVSTDYTEIMAIKQSTSSWKIALFLPLITLPQIILLGWLLNQS